MSDFLERDVWDIIVPSLLAKRSDLEVQLNIPMSFKIYQGSVILHFTQDRLKVMGLDCKVIREMLYNSEEPLDGEAYYSLGRMLTSAVSRIQRDET